MRPSVMLLACAFTLLSGLQSSRGQGSAIEHNVSVPMSVVGNAPIITLTFNKPGGGVRTAQFVFDSGGGAIILDQDLAMDIGLKPEGAIISEDGQQYQPVEIPEASIGGMPLDLHTSKAFVHQGTGSFTNRNRVEGLLPGKALEHYQVVLDYPLSGGQLCGQLCR
jgi:hypothetical protein